MRATATAPIGPAAAPVELRDEPEPTTRRGMNMRSQLGDLVRQPLLLDQNTCSDATPGIGRHSAVGPVTVLALAPWNPLAVGESGEDAGAIVAGQAMLYVPRARSR
jgi:hypothetical protein